MSPRGTDASTGGETTSAKGTAVDVDVAVGRRSRSNVLLFLLGPIIWTVYFLVVYLVVEAGCTGDGPGLNLFDPPVPTVVTLIATAIAAIASLVAALWCYRRWRPDEQEADNQHGDGSSERDRSLAFAGLLLCLLGFVAVLFIGLPALALPAC